MKLIVCALALVALTQATDDIDWSKVMPRHVLPVLPDIYDNPPSQKIGGGIEAVPNSIPYQVAIVKTTAGKIKYCGGSLISTKYVLTSAGCVNGAISVQVRLGAHRVHEAEDTQVHVTSTKITIHPGYANYKLHNIAVIELPSDVELNDNIKPIPLPTWADAANDYAGYFAKISGWEFNNSIIGTRSVVLHYVFADIITNSECSSSFSYITNSHICTNEHGGVGTCDGDEGGPLVADFKQVGIVSSDINLCWYNYPSVFIRVTYYLDWIAQNTDVVIKQ